MFTIIKPYLSVNQAKQFKELIHGEEKISFQMALSNLTQTISTMPITYEQDGKGDEAIIYLHYFMGGADWYITEKDMSGGTSQAFGYANIFGDSGELGYISIDEITNCGAELDIHWTPRTIAEIKQ